MKVILYSATESDLRLKTLDLLQRTASPEEVEVYRDVHSLMSRLSLNFTDISILILLIGNLMDLNGLLQIRNHIIGHRVILVLPDQNPATLSKAHSLYPRFLSYVDSDLDDLASVLNKMIHFYVNNSRAREATKEPETGQPALHT